MKKLIPSIPFILICLVCLFISTNTTAQRKLHKKLIGTWQICNPDSTVATNFNNSNSLFRYKIITGETFMVSEIKKQNKQIQSALWGTYSVKNNKYSEFVQYANTKFEHVIGEMNSFDIKIDKDLMFIKGTNNDLNEIWKKVKS